MEPSMERGSTARVGRAEDNEGRLSSAPLHPLSLLANEDHLPQEVEEGNVEYKLKLNPSPERLQHLVTQMKWRLAEGHGEALYEIGIADNGQLVGLSAQDLEQTLSTLKTMAQTLHADVSVIRQRNVKEEPEQRWVAEVLVRKCIDEEQFMELKVAVIGGVDSGKSTLLGVLSYSEMDNGRGRARLNLLRHRHEIASGRTSSISRQIIGFDAKGRLINYSSTNICSVEQICEAAPKIVTFLDTCGHPKFQKTTISGLTGHAPDYACFMVAANSGALSETAREHLGLTVIFGVPVFICLTKIDVAETHQLTATLSSLLSILKSPGLKRVPVVIQSEDDIVNSITSFVDSKADRVIPIFLVSSVTGENINLLTRLMNLLPKPLRNIEKLLEAPMEFQVEEVYSVPDVGSVVAGILKVGRMSIQNHTYIDCYLGPDRGRFIPIRVQSIHRQRSRIRHIQAGQAATCAISFTGTGDASTTPPADFRIRKGQVISPSLPPHAFWEFEAEIHVLYHSSALTVGYQGVVYCGNVRQGAQVVHISPGSPRISPVLSPTHAPDLFLSQSPSPSTPTPRRSTSPVPSPFSLCTGQSGTIKLRFVYEPEWLTVGSTLLFRGEGRMKCVGKVASLSADVTPLPRAR